MYQSLRKMPELAALTICILLGLGFFALTKPASLPPAALMFGFVILLGVMYSFARLILKLTGLKQRVSHAQYTGILAGVTVLPVLLLALQSLGQLTVRDTVTLLVLSAAGYLYLSRVAGKR